MDTETPTLPALTDAAAAIYEPDFCYHECGVMLSDAPMATASVFLDAASVSLHIDTYGDFRIATHFVVPIAAARALHALLGRALAAAESV